MGDKVQLLLNILSSVLANLRCVQDTKPSSSTVLSRGRKCIDIWIATPMSSGKSKYLPDVTRHISLYTIQCHGVIHILHCIELVFLPIVKSS